MKAIVASISSPQRIYRVGNSLPWPHLQKEIAHLFEIVRGQIIIVDPVTFSLLPENLPHSFCFIVGNKLPVSCHKNSDCCIMCKDIYEAINKATVMPEKSIFFLGGEEVWQEALKVCTDIFLTEINRDCRFQNPSLGPLQFFHDFDSLNHLWMVRGITHQHETVNHGDNKWWGKLPNHVQIKFTHYQKLDHPELIGKD